MFISHVCSFFLKTVCTGAWMNKFTSDGRGPLHPRFFWVDPTTMKVLLYNTAALEYCLLRYIGPKLSKLVISTLKIQNQVCKTSMTGFKRVLCLCIGFIDFLVGVRSSASTSILKRKDFDPIAKHKFAFTVFTNNK